MSYEDTAVLLLSHGSTLPYAEKVFKDICAKFKVKTGIDAEVGYMKVAKPNLPQAIEILKERNPDLKRIIATPVFLAAGIHTNIDIPIILGLEPKEVDPRQPDGNYPEGHYLVGLEDVDFDGDLDLLGPIGPNPKLLEIINNKISGAIEGSELDDDAKTGVLLVVHGSRLNYSKEFITDLFAQFEAQCDYPCDFGFMELVERDGTTYFLYYPDSKPQPQGGPSAWGSAAFVSAVDEALAGIIDEGVNYDEITFAPKFPVTPYTELRYITGYEVTNTMVDVRYILKEEGMRYDIYSPAKKIKAHILLPKGRECKTVLINSKEISFEKVFVAESPYVDFCIGDLDGKVSVEILFN